MEIIPLAFVKTPEGQTDLANASNLELLYKYIFPIIVQNEGWDTANLTISAFENDPQQFQQEITLSTWDNVHVAVMDGEPIGLLEYEKDMIETGTYQSIPVMREILNNENHPLWKVAYDKSNSDYKPNFNELKDFLYKTPLYHEIGITIAPKYQGKKTGVTEKLYSKFDDGISFGWTSNPIIVKQQREIRSEILCYPLFGEKVDTPKKFGMHLHVVADLSTHPQEKVDPYEFGVMSSEYFVSDRGEKYKELAKQMNAAGKFSNQDLARILYVLQFKKVQAAIIRMN